jgi:hypothetical protein
LKRFTWLLVLLNGSAGFVAAGSGFAGCVVVFVVVRAVEGLAGAGLAAAGSVTFTHALDLVSVTTSSVCANAPALAKQSIPKIMDLFID